MKVYIGTDLEGVAGVVSSELQCQQQARYYDQAKRLLTAEINAAVEGMLEEGVKEVLVWDGHGCGGVWYEDLHPAVRLIHGRPMAPFKVLQEVIAGFDACMLIGQHAMAGTADGNLNHTQNSRAIDSYKLNGRPIGELAQFALFCGAMGVPMIFLTGDQAACREARELIPEITTVAVKEGLGRYCAISLAPSEARRRIRMGASEAIAKHKESPIAPLVCKGPFVLEKRFFHTDVADAAGAGLGAERIDSQTVRYRADNILDIIYYR